MADKVWQHNAIAQKVGAPTAAGDPGSYAWEHDNTQHVVYRGTDGQIHEIWYRKGKDWAYGGPLSRTVGAQPAAGDPDGYAWESDDTQHIIYRGADNMIHELWQRRGQPWKYGGAMNAKLGAPLAAGDPCGWAWERDDTQHILYRGVDNNVHELWQRRGKDWKYGGVMNLKIGAPAAASDPLGFAWENDDTQHIIYRGNDNQIHELWQRRGQDWKYDGSLTLRFGAPPAASKPYGYAWKRDKTQHILYRGQDNMVHELWFRIGEGWKYGGALNAIAASASDQGGGLRHLLQRSEPAHVPAGVPTAQGDPSGYAWEDDDTQHVIYWGQDGHVHELWQRRGEKWKYGTALSATTGGPMSKGRPSGFAWEGDDTQHIVYCGVDNQIHEIWFRK